MLVTGEGVRVELPYASLPSRSVAAALDLTLSTASALLLTYLLVKIFGGSVNGALLEAILVAALTGAFLGYPVAMTALTGRTLGKMALGLRVVRDDGAPVGWRESFIRELAGLVVEKPGPLFGFPALVTMVSREDGKRVGDMLGGTVVLSTRVPLVSQRRMTVPPAAAEWAAGLDLSRVSDAAAARGRAVLQRSASLSSGASTALIRPVAEEIASAIGGVPTGARDLTWLAAVLEERRHREERRLTRAPMEATFGVAAWDR